MNKGVIGGIAAAIVIGIIVGVYAISNTSPNSEINETELDEQTTEENPNQSKSFKIELEEKMGIKGVP